MSHSGYVPALRFDWLTPVYDPVVRLTTREATFKNALIGQAEMQGGDSVLDIGCGSGTLARLLHEALPELDIHGIDGDSSILGIAKAKISPNGEGIHFVQALSFLLPYPNESFDHIFSSLFFHHLTSEDKLTTLKEILRVLKPGGEFHVADWGDPDNFLMKLGSYMVMALDGTETTRDNFEGRLPELVLSAGFEDLKETAALNTAFGTIRIFKSTKTRE
ncbi:MAG: class I SAM-dependent methyltransferase [Pyrinomonadaceae bacterium]|nr:class I SAM-dependent methyltransferase [Pyrinomonadaceae bacterium]